MKLELILTFLVLISIKGVICNGSEVPIEEQWAQCSLDYEKYSWPLKDTLVQLLRNVSSDPSIKLSAHCKNSLKSFADGIIDRSQWAFQRKFNQLPANSNIFKI